MLGSGLLGLVALSRAGSTLFWRQSDQAATGEPVDGARMGAVLLLLAASPALVVMAGPLLSYLAQTAEQLLMPQLYIDAVLSLQPIAGAAQ